MRDNLSRKVKLWNDKSGRNEYERLANLYALIRSVERLETAYVNSAAHAGAYEAACSELITKYKTLRNALVDTVPDVHRFMTTYSIQFATARHRLQIGMPATVEHRVVHLGEPPSAVSVAECVHNYIGLIDTLKLNMAAKDQVAPYLSDLLTSLYKVRQLPTDFSGTTFVRRWTVQLDKMRASDELGEDEIRQLLYDTENSYNAFMRLLGGHEQHVLQHQS